MPALKITVSFPVAIQLKEMSGEHISANDINAFPVHRRLRRTELSIVKDGTNYIVSFVQGDEVVRHVVDGEYKTDLRFWWSTGYYDRLTITYLNVVPQYLNVVPQLWRWKTTISVQSDPMENAPGVVIKGSVSEGAASGKYLTGNVPIKVYGCQLSVPHAFQPKAWETRNVGVHPYRTHAVFTDRILADTFRCLLAYNFANLYTGVCWDSGKFPPNTSDNDTLLIVREFNEGLSDYFEALYTAIERLGVDEGTHLGLYQQSSPSWTDADGEDYDLQVNIEVVERYLYFI